MQCPGLCDVAIQRILKYHFGAFLALRTVSKAFKDATCEPDVWRDVDLSCFNNPLTLLADYGSMIRILALPGYVFDSLNLEMYCAHLVSLDLENTTVDDELVLPKTLERLVVSHGTFQKLDLSDFDALRTLHAINTEDVIPPANKNLEVVSARGTDCLTLSHLVGDNMRKLTIQGDEEDHWELLARCKGLTSLSVFCAETLRDQFLPMLAELPLEKIRLTRAAVVSAHAWADFIRQHKTPWRSFDVRESDGFNEFACVPLADKFAVQGRCLRYLNLSWCFTLRDTEVMMVLDHVPFLEVLKLKGLRHISYLAVLSVFTKPYTCLQRLDVAKDLCVAPSALMKKYAALVARKKILYARFEC
eukprot:GEMP01056450.1.p1 GENE.GEMP01056450.1~~GEMP01056450.1.p1  ORF type:complete len:360 (+),score=69.39 GEMP01056450.1:114-1193(+)